MLPPLTQGAIKPYGLNNQWNDRSSSEVLLPGYYDCISGIGGVQTSGTRWHIDGMGDLSLDNELGVNRAKQHQAGEGVCVRLNQSVAFA